MPPIARSLEKTVAKATRAFGAVVITGPRRSGKTYLFRQLFPKAGYFLFEDPDTIGRFRADPQGFLDGIKTPVILDEIQNVPELFNFVRSRIDRTPSRKGQWLLTGSQESGLMRNVTESMAGRAAVLQLLPLSLAESPKVSLLRGGYPEVLLKPRSASLWFASYLQTYLERDVRSVSAVQDLPKFRRFMTLLATRHSAVLNRTDLAAPLGMSVPGISNWLDILEATGLIMLVPPYFENFGKRLIKSPRVYWLDSGLVCHLLNIETEAALERSPFLGALFEGWVAAEIVKSQINAGRRRELYYFRDQQGLEVDFIAPAPPRKNHAAGMWMIEAKASRSPSSDMARPMLALAKAWPSGPTAQPLTNSFLVHRPARHPVDSSALAQGVKAITLAQLSSALNMS
jgi:uncharacterized protein